MANTLSPSGSVLDTREYDAYGRELAVRTPMSVGSMATDPFGFNARWGYYDDREIGTYHCGAREYDPGTARWLERDPIGLAGGVNPYAYCAANPVGNIDPEGTTIVIRGPGEGNTDLADPRDENEIRRQLKRIGAPGSPLQQLVYDLIADKCVHVIRPLRPEESTYDIVTYAPQGETLYSPWKPHVNRKPKGDLIPGPGVLLLPTSITNPPDVVLAHELGHHFTHCGTQRHLDDPVSGDPARAGDNVADVENPYRKYRGLPRRARY